MTAQKFTPTMLLILDGYGLAPAGPGNAASLANTPNINRVVNNPGRSTLAASGRSVGLPEGFIGNSEVGHLNIGAGRVVYQDMTRIDISIESGELFQNPVLLDLLEKTRASGGRVHFMGLLSDGGVHSHINHLHALLRLAKDQKVPALVHAFMDGRDTSPTSGVDYVRRLQAMLTETGNRLASICGRFYAMDRDRRWERVEEAWKLLVDGQGLTAPDPIAALEAAYAQDETDEFIKPRLILPAEEACIKDGDGIFFFNFRADRARELVTAFIDPNFSGFTRQHTPKLAGLATLTMYEANFPAPVPVAFVKDNLENTLGEVVSNLGLAQLRIAETEKYAHVTYFYSGGREDPFPEEDRILVPSPKEVPTYDLKPQMSAEEVTDKLIAAWNSGKYSYVVCNLANPDMVGHTGVIPAAINALEVVDKCLARIEEAVLNSGGRLFITADHGNVEQMLTDDGKPMTAHTLNRTPFVALEKDKTIFLHDNDGQAKLGDIAPTILDLWGITPPAEMAGVSLLKK